MNVACTACPAKYAVPDERVRGKRARITCKHCGTSIIVDGTTLGGPEPVTTATGSRPARRTIMGMGSPNQVRATAAALLSSPSHAPVPAAGGSAWLVALADGRREPASQARVVDLYASGAIDARTYIWREGMPDWKPLFSVPDIAAAIQARGLAGEQSGANGAPASSRGFDGQEEATQVGVAVSDMLRASAEPPHAPPASSRRPAVGDDEDITIARSGPPSVPFGRPAQSRTVVGLPPPRNLARPPSEPPPAAPRRSTLPPNNRMASQRPSVIDDFAIPLTGSAAPPPPPPPPPPAAAPVMAPARSVPPVAAAVITPQSSWPAQPAPSLGELSAAVAPAVAAIPGPVARNPAEFEPAPRSGAPVAVPLEYPFAAQRRRRKVIALAVLGTLVAAAAGAFIYFGTRPAPRPAPAPVVAAPAPTRQPEPAPAPTPAPEPTPAPATTAAAPEPSAAEPKLKVKPLATPAVAAAAPRETSSRSAAPHRAETPRPTKSSDSEEDSESTEASSEPPAAATTAAADEKDSATTAGAGSNPFDRESAAQALGDASAKASSCKTLGGPTGTAAATVTFSPNGRVLGVSVGGDFSGTLVGACIAKLFRAASVPAFAGDPVTVTKRFTVE